MSQNDKTAITLSMWIEREKKFASQLDTLQKALKQKHLCEICICNEKCFALKPCGHTYCEDCTTKMMDKQTCAMCRADILKTFRIYL